MDRIKDITKLRLFKGGILIKIHEKKKRLIQTLEDDPEISKHDVNFSHGVVVAKADNVNWLEVGDVVLDFGSAQVFRWHEEKYCIVMDMTINIITTADNFDPKQEKQLAV